MFKKLSIVLGTGVVLAGFVGHASADYCVETSGKITNNMQLDGNTLGIVAMKLDGEKFKCGISGKREDPNASVDFKHTIVCNDKVGTDDAHAQVTFNTWFAADPENVAVCPGYEPGDPDAVYSLSFLENSVPDPATARGAFSNIKADGSLLIISGDITCFGKIDMKFNGQLCFFSDE